MRSNSNHVLDVISVTWDIGDSDVVLGCLEFREGEINGNTALTLSLQLFENPSVLERTLIDFTCFGFELVIFTFVDTTSFVDQVTSGGRLSGIYVSDNDCVDMQLFLCAEVSE